VTDERLAGHPRNLANAESKAVTPINPAAQKFHLLILCKAPDNSVALSNSFIPGLMLGTRHIAAANQNTAEPHAVIIAPVSMHDRITAPKFALVCDYTLFRYPVIILAVDKKSTSRSP
jgi:hypothetical protein